MSTSCSCAKKWPDMWRAKNFQLHHDNAPAHCAHVIQDFLAKNGMPLVRQALYSLSGFGTM